MVMSSRQNSRPVPVEKFTLAKAIINTRLLQRFDRRMKEKYGALWRNGNLAKQTHGRRASPPTIDNKTNRLTMAHWRPAFAARRQSIAVFPLASSCTLARVLLRAHITTTMKLLKWRPKSNLTTIFMVLNGNDARNWITL